MKRSLIKASHKRGFTSGVPAAQNTSPLAGELKNKRVKKRWNQKVLLGLLAVAITMPAMASPSLLDITTGIDGAANTVKGVFSNVSNLVLMVGAIVGLAGGIRVYNKWNNGDQDVQKELIGWAGACVFLLLSGTTLKLFFGL